jgi:uncharacterized protein (TIGR02145 family)
LPLECLRWCAVGDADLPANLDKSKLRTNILLVRCKASLRLVYVVEKSNLNLNSRNMKTRSLIIASAVCFAASVVFSDEVRDNKEDRAWIAYAGRDESNSGIPRTVVAAGLEWQTYNMNVSRFKDGEAIPQVRTDALRQGKPAWSYYENDAANGQRYGKLYNRHALDDARFGLNGWRLPTRGEWEALIRELNGGKAEGNGIGLNAVAAGFRDRLGDFHGMGDHAVFAAVDDDGGGIGSVRIRITDGGTLEAQADAGDQAGILVRLVREPLPYHTHFDIAPSGVPNPGILLFDHESRGRSGHMPTATLTECANGDIIAFSVNSSSQIRGGHLYYGWSEYKRSTDGGETWGERQVFKYSRKAWDKNDELGLEGRDRFGVVVTGVVTAPDGTIVAFLSPIGQNAAQAGYANWSTLVSLSHDHGHTWEAPRLLGDAAPDERSGVTYNAAWVHDGTIYLLVIEGTGGDGPISLYTSRDNGRRFEHISRGLFPGETLYYYKTGRVLEDGRIVVYTYKNNPSEDILRVFSDDGGKTWTEPEKVSFAKRIRNQQMSDRVGGLYFMHGRSGSRGPDPRKLVLYSSPDGIHWDDGVFLNRGEGVENPGSDSYTGNTVVGVYDASLPERLLVQSSIAYQGQRTNQKYWWIMPLGKAFDSASKDTD